MLEEIEGAGYDIGGFAVVASVEFALDLLLGLGVEGDLHGSIAPWWGTQEQIARWRTHRGKVAMDGELDVWAAPPPDVRVPRQRRLILDLVHSHRVPS